MATKKSSRRRRSLGFVAIPFSTSIALATLADGVVIKVALTPAALGEDLFIMSIDSNFVVEGLTPTEGPLQVGFAHGDLSVGEIGEALNAEQTDPDDIIAKERAKRPVRTTGSFNGLLANEGLNDGKILRTKMKFSVGDGHDIDAWVMNRSGATLTTGATMRITGTVFGRWQR